MKSVSLTLKSLSETEAFGELLGQNVRAGDIICLDGDLGAGKTTLTQAIARGMQVPEHCYVTSPSFAIMHEYPGRLPLYHMDFYRLEDAGEVEDLGFDEYFYGSGVTVIEWSNRAIEILPDERLCLYIEIKDVDQRNVSIVYTRNYKRFVSLLAKFL